MTLNRNRVFYLLVCFCISIGTIMLLFNFSFRVNNKANGFIRLFPPHRISALAFLDLKLNSYFIAGITEKRIYLGNFSTPRILYSFNHEFKDLRTFLLAMPANLKLSKGTSLEFRVDSPMVTLISYRDS